MRRRADSLRGGLRHSVGHGLNGHQRGFDGSLGCGMALVAGRKGGLINQQKKAMALTPSDEPAALAERSVKSELLSVQSVFPRTRKPATRPLPNAHLA